ncbi:MAG TPA: ATP-dependent zinc metalloprotease FtsH [Solirubrobacteraceae bacterium]|nr:ATP-dependent zinc metalloprotease FtsH [Solirubrobacteraceae bacterium]
MLALLVVNNLVGLALAPSQERTKVTYTFFREQVQRGNVSEIESRNDTIQGNLRKATRYQPSPSQASEVKGFETVRPSLGDDALLTTLLDKGVSVNAKPLDQGRPVWETLLVGFGPTLLLVGLFVVLARRAASAAGGLGGLGGLGRSRAKRYEQPGRRTTFADVAGIDEVKEELAEIVGFLRQPHRYHRLGARIPKGVLLTGLPGTGKTLLARAVAGEADVPFFSLSASEFIEMVVGVGASRVRDLFEQAKQVAPAIIFIDELDAVGRARGAGPMIGGHDEREQTLNQILSEMDGFSGSEGVVVLSATNRPEILDAALLRPGRFDRRVEVSPPDRDGRRAILEVHTCSVPLGDDVDLAQIARQTPGMVGADLRNLVNEAALTAARRKHERVQLADFTDALERIVLGAERRITISPEERGRTAYHEAGHAILGMLELGADRVRKVSIVPRGRALGVTFQSPDVERYAHNASYLRGRIVVALGGRAAEEIVYGDVTTGAESDLEQVTRIARQMVGRWGMSDAVGPMSVLPAPGQEATLVPGGDAPSEATRQLVESEARRIVDECYARAVGELGDKRDRLDRLAAALLEHETLDEADAYRIAGVERDDQCPQELNEAVSSALNTGNARSPTLVSRSEA